MSLENRLKAKTAKEDLLMWILSKHLTNNELKELLKENHYTEACKKIDEHYGIN